MEVSEITLYNTLKQSLGEEQAQVVIDKIKKRNDHVDEIRDDLIRWMFILSVSYVIAVYLMLCYFFA